MVLLNSDFDTQSAQHTGGVTGSAKVKHKVQNAHYQMMLLAAELRGIYPKSFNCFC